MTGTKHQEKKRRIQNEPFLFFFSLSNGIENDMIFMSILDPLGAAAGSTEAGGGGQVAVRMVVDVVVVGVGRRVVVHPGSLWAV